MRIGIVNDLPLAIEALRRVVSIREQHRIAWTARNGREAVDHCRRDRPDLILMDLLMPVMDGVEATRRIMTDHPCAILVVTFSISGNVSKVFEAMGAGALDAVDTPTLALGDPGQEGAALLAKIDMMSRLLGEGSPRLNPSPMPSCGAGSRGKSRMVVIGASAGGPAALAAVLGGLPVDFPAAVVVVQHVDARYAGPLVSWLQEQVPLPVRGAVEGDRPREGEVLLAIRNRHLALGQTGRLGYRAEPSDVFHHPSVDLFFESVARHWKGEAIGVILTGMGRDGAVGLKQLREAGFHTIAQDEASCAVYGMPKAAAETGAAIEILSLEKIAPALKGWCSIP